MSLRLRDAAVERDGWREREFELELEEERAAGVLWTPLQGARPGIVLLGHGFTTGRRCHSLVPAARRLAGRCGLTAASLDMPVHGTRWHGAADASFEERHRAWAAQWRAGGYERIPREWQRLLAALRAGGDAPAGPVGYWGLSLATQYGVALLAREPGIDAAVLGLFGAGPLVARLAPDIRCPVAFIQQRDDELHARASTDALFEGLGSEDKRLLSSPGGHEAVPPAVYEEAVDFLARHLGSP